MEKFVFAHDVGTSSVKSALISARGEVISHATTGYGLTYPKPGWVEQDQDDLYTSSARTIKECVEKSGINPADVAAIEEALADPSAHGVGVDASPGDVHPVEQDLAAVQGVQQCQGPQQHGLAGARWADHHHHLSALDPSRKIDYGLDAVGKGLVDMLNDDDLLVEALATLVDDALAPTMDPSVIREI